MYQVKKKVITTQVTEAPVIAPTVSSDKLCTLFLYRTQPASGRKGTNAVTVCAPKIKKRPTSIPEMPDI